MTGGRDRRQAGSGRKGGRPHGGKAGPKAAPAMSSRPSRSVRRHGTNAYGADDGAMAAQRAAEAAAGRRPITARRHRYRAAGDGACRHCGLPAEAGVHA